MKALWFPSYTRFIREQELIAEKEEKERKTGFITIFHITIYIYSLAISLLYYAGERIYICVLIIISNILFPSLPINNKITFSLLYYAGERIYIMVP